MEIRIDGLEFTRNGRNVLSIPSLRIRSTSRTAILGPNGAGKTTLLRLIAGLERPDVGQLLVGGEAATCEPGRVAYAFQENVFLRRSILANLELAVRLTGRSRADARLQARQALRLLGIESLEQRAANGVSGGEARRASLARALCVDAPVLLLDEPMAGLDGTTYARLLDDLPALLAQKPATVVLVTHDPEEALRLADDLVVLVDGRVIASGAKGDVAGNPQRVDVALSLGYTVLNVDDRYVAVPPGTLRPGRGTREFVARVDRIIDLVFAWDVLVTVTSIRLHVQLPRADDAPKLGDTIFVHAPTAYEVLP
jgi:ABC-type nitrate/sulfonate/bicarbonate transport system ATPase subunit